MWGIYGTSPPPCVRGKSLQVFGKVATAGHLFPDGARLGNLTLHIGRETKPSCTSERTSHPISLGRGILDARSTKHLSCGGQKGDKIGKWQGMCQNNRQKAFFGNGMQGSFLFLFPLEKKTPSVLERTQNCRQHFACCRVGGGLCTLANRPVPGATLE